MTIRLVTADTGVETLYFDGLNTPHAIATRRGGHSEGRYASLNLGPRSGDDPARVRANRHRLLAALGLSAMTILAPRQTHSAAVAVYHAGDPLPPGRVFDGDGIVTNATGVALMVLAADCAPLLFQDPVRGVIGAVHAGWRGTAGGIAAVAVRCLVETIGCRPADLHAGIGPAIGRCCYEVGQEVVAAVGAATPGGAEPLIDPRPGGKALLDLVGANVAQLVGAGVNRAHIEAAELCTACRTDLFYSHRREGEPTGRNGAVIALG